jgi:prepilin-type N-terminal cleavage/methylation domain-containing protein
MKARLIRDGRGMTMIELCIVIVILGILMVTGVAALLRARMNSNESAAIAGLRATVSAQFAYLSGCGAGNYATSYVILGTKPSPNNQGYISPDLGAEAVPRLSGYTFRLALGRDGAPGVTQDCNGNPTWTTYYATAVPNVPGQTGDRSFATNQRQSIYQANNSTPPAEPFGPGTQLVQ